MCLIFMKKNEHWLLEFNLNITHSIELKYSTQFVFDYYKLKTFIMYSRRRYTRCCLKGL